MYLVKSNEEMASDFITGTCEVVPKFCSSSDHMHDLSEGPLPKQHVIVCGSRAEFYIRPLNICIGDIDYLLCKADQLAFSGDFPVLPSDISGLADTIHCFKIKSYPGIPGFVRLRYRGEMKYNWKHKEYKLNRNNNSDIYIKLGTLQHLNSCVKLDKYMLPRDVCGPAIKCPSFDFESGYGIGIDAVYCLFCPQWPRDAQTWPLRPRNNGN